MDAIRPWLYVGKYRETLNASLLAARNISAMLHLAEKVTHPRITTLYLPVDDGVPIPEHLLRQGVDFVLSAKQRGQTVLIACGAGTSRSTAFAVAVLKQAEDLSLPQALRVVSLHHPGTLPHPEIWRSLCSYYHEDVPILDMWNALKTNSEG
jgi:predicted protein tyrosine phosphatase